MNYRFTGKHDSNSVFTILGGDIVERYDLEDWLDLEIKEVPKEERKLRPVIRKLLESALFTDRFINEEYFVDFAKEYAADVIGVNEYDWPYDHIDWESAAD